MTKTPLLLTLTLAPLLASEQLQIERPSRVDSAKDYLAEVWNKDKRAERKAAYKASRGIANPLKERIEKEVVGMGYVGDYKERVLLDIMSGLPEESSTYEPMMLSAMKNFTDPKERLDDVYSQIKPLMATKIDLYKSSMTRARKRRRETKKSRIKEFFQTLFDPSTSRDVEEMAYLMAAKEQSPWRRICSSVVNFFEHASVSLLKGVRSLFDSTYRDEIKEKGITRTCSRAILRSGSPSVSAIGTIVSVCGALMSGGGLAVMKALGSTSVATPFLALATPFLAVVSAGVAAFIGGYHFAAWLGLPKPWRYGCGGLFSLIAVIVGLLIWGALKVGERKKKRKRRNRWRHDD